MTENTATLEEHVPKPQANSSLAILVTSDGMGRGEPELQHRLIHSYFRLLQENGTLPVAIGFYTDGVKLLVEGSPVLGLLQSYEEQGVVLIACGTCLDYYGLMDKLQVGIVGHMSDVIELQLRADKVVTI